MFADCSLPETGFMAYCFCTPNPTGPRGRICNKHKDRYIGEDYTVPGASYTGMSSVHCRARAWTLLRIVGDSAEGPLLTEQQRITRLTDHFSLWHPRWPGITPFLLLRKIGHIVGNPGFADAYSQAALPTGQQVPLPTKPSH